MKTHSWGIANLSAAFLVIAILLVAAAAGLTLVKFGHSTTNTTTNTPPKSSTTTTSITSDGSNTHVATSSPSSQHSTTSPATSSSSTTDRSTSSSSSSSSQTQASSSSSSSSNTTSTTLQGVTLVDQDFPASNSIFNSVNQNIYASWWSYSQGSYNNSFLIILNNGTQIAHTTFNQPFIGAVSLQSYNSYNGTVFVLYPGAGGGHNGGCGFSTYGTIDGTSFGQQGQFFGSSAQGLTGADVYDGQYRYFAFAEGGPQATANPCGVGLVVWEDNSSQFFVQTGPQSPNIQTGYSWYAIIPSLAYNSLNGAIYVPTLNETYSNGPAADATYLYTVSGFSALPVNYTIPGLTQSLFFDSANQELYAEQFFSSNNSVAILVINPATGSVLGSISLAQVSPMVFDSTNQMVYAFEKTQILEISGTQVVHTYNEPGSQQPTSAVYDSTNNELVAFCNCTSSNQTLSNASGSSSSSLALFGMNFLQAISLILTLEATGACGLYLLKSQNGLAREH